MSKLNCICGEITDLSNIPCEHDWLVISDVEFDKWNDNNTSVEKFYTQMKLITRCPNCGRLYIYWNGTGNPPIVYKIERPDAADL